MWRSYRTLTGTVIMRVARAKIGAIEFETFVESPLFGAGELLLGCEVLNKLIIVVDGLGRQACLSEEVTANRFSSKRKR